MTTTNTPDSSSAVSHPMLRRGHFATVSGLTGKLLDGSFAINPQDQFVQVFKNLTDALIAAGLRAEDIVQVTCFHRDLRNLDAFVATMAKTFPAELPCQHVGVSSLTNPKAWVELQVLADAGSETVISLVDDTTTGVSGQSPQDALQRVSVALTKDNESRAATAAERKKARSIGSDSLRRILTALAKGTEGLPKEPEEKMDLKSRVRSWQPMKLLFDVDDPDNHNYWN